jgi:hypothetical protein
MSPAQRSPAGSFNRCSSAALFEFGIIKQLLFLFFRHLGAKCEIIHRLVGKNKQKGENPHGIWQQA